MGFSSGTYSRTNGVNTGANTWADDRDEPVAILATRHDTHDEDIASALSMCVLKDGTQTITADIPFNSNKITGLSAGTAVTDAVTLAQLQNSSVQHGSVGGTGGQ